MSVTHAATSFDFTHEADGLEMPGRDGVDGRLAPPQLKLGLDAAPPPPRPKPQSGETHAITVFAKKIRPDTNCRVGIAHHNAL